MRDFEIKICIAIDNASDMLSTTERINIVEEEKVTAEGEISNSDSGK